MMSLSLGDTRFCKVTHFENGRSFTRRVHSMTVQAADGRCFHLFGEQLPDTIALYTGQLYHGKHLADVLLKPSKVKAIPLIPAPTGILTKRDAAYLVLGMFLFGLIQVLSGWAAQALVT